MYALPRHNRHVVLSGLHHIYPVHRGTRMNCVGERLTFLRPLVVPVSRGAPGRRGRVRRRPRHTVVVRPCRRRRRRVQRLRGASHRDHVGAACLPEPRRGGGSGRGGDGRRREGDCDTPPREWAAHGDCHERGPGAAVRGVGARTSALCLPSMWFLGLDGHDDGEGEDVVCRFFARETGVVHGFQKR